MSLNRIVGGESCGEGVGEVGGSNQRGGEGRINVCRVDDEGGAGGGDEEMQEPGDDNNNNEEEEEGVEEEGLASSSDDDEDGIVGMIVRVNRTRTRNPRVFNDDFV